MLFMGHLGCAKIRGATGSSFIKVSAYMNKNKLLLPACREFFMKPGERRPDAATFAQGRWRIFRGQ
jgi:hypothetical protein